MTVALGLVQLGPAFILVVLMVVLSLLSPYFLTIRNMQNLGAQTAIVCALALGQLLVIVVDDDEEGIRRRLSLLARASH